MNNILKKFILALLLTAFACNPMIAMSDSDMSDGPEMAANLVPISDVSEEESATAAPESEDASTKSKKKSRQSHANVKVPAINYCRDIIDALNKDNKREVIRYIFKVYAKIPSELKDLIVKGQGNIKRINAHKKFHLSLFYLIGLCIINATTNEADMGEDLNNTINIDMKACTVHFIVKNKNEKNYKITFTIKKELDSSEEEFELPWEVRIEDTEKTEDAVDIGNGYTRENFFKQTVYSLIPNENIEESQTNIEQRLTKLFNNTIPLKIQVPYERYYHFMLFSLIKLMGSHACDGEYYAGDGRADLILQNEFGKCIIELKHKKSGGAKPAVDQIRDQQYMNIFDTSVLAVGINFKIINKKTIAVECKIETINIESKVTAKADESCSIELKSKIKKVKPKKEAPAQKDSDSLARKRSRDEKSDAKAQKHEPAAKKPKTAPAPAPAPAPASPKKTNVGSSGKKWKKH